MIVTDEYVKSLQPPPPQPSMPQQAGTLPWWGQNQGAPSDMSAVPQMFQMGAQAGGMGGPDAPPPDAPPEVSWVDDPLQPQGGYYDDHQGHYDDGSGTWTLNPFISQAPYNPLPVTGFGAQPQMPIDPNVPLDTTQVEDRRTPPFDPINWWNRR